MKKSNLNQEIEEFLKIKDDLNDLIHQKFEEGFSKDDILNVVSDHFQDKTGERIKHSQLVKLWTDAKVSTRKGGSGYRQRTCELFIETDGKVTQKEWEDVMIDEGLLKSIVNYRQHFVVYQSLWFHREMS